MTMKTLRMAAKVGGGVVVATAAVAAVAGYLLGRKMTQSALGGDYDGDGDWDEDGAVGIMNRGTAFRDMIRAGKEMKRAWDRIQRDVKVIAKRTVDLKDDADEEDEDEDEEDE